MQDPKSCDGGSLFGGSEYMTNGGYDGGYDGGCGCDGGYEGGGLLDDMFGQSAGQTGVKWFDYSRRVVSVLLVLYVLALIISVWFSWSFGIQVMYTVFGVVLLGLNMLMDLDWVQGKVRGVPSQ